MDWRELAGYPTASGWGKTSFDNDIWSGGKKIESLELSEPSSGVGTDPIRSWIIATCWLLASGAECVPSQ